MRRAFIHGHVRRRNNALARKLAALYEREGNLFPGGIENAVIRRTYAGPHMRSAGAWSWFLEALDSPLVAVIGSQWRAREVARGGFTVESTPHGDLEFVFAAPPPPEPRHD